jgi:lipopolysaccharide/colanic/teichoic acid biosynthesis glycosyltransferase
MHVGAEERVEELRRLHAVENLMFKIPDDPRVTPVGRLLRRFSLDELPQLFNVLRGQMSLVGPRPPLAEEVTRYEDWQFDRLEVPPGITGLWQVSGRSELSFDECVRLDLFYIENWSLTYDLFILAKTLPALLSRRGAY